MNKLSIILRKKRLLPLVCLAISVGLLIAGLWPFQFRPANNVHWIDGQAGLRFDRYGMVYGRAPLFTPGGPSTSRSLLRSGWNCSLATNPPTTSRGSCPCTSRAAAKLFILGQWKSALNLRILERQRAYYLEYQETEVGNFRKGAKRSILLSSGATGLTVYAEGKLVFTRPGFGFSLLPGNRDPAWLLLGNSPSGESPWRGDLLSLSFYPTRFPRKKSQPPGSIPWCATCFRREAAPYAAGGPTRATTYSSPRFSGRR